MSWKMIPFTEIPETITWLELQVRSALLGAATGLMLSPVIWLIVRWR